jgi:hypothetical protein
MVHFRNLLIAAAAAGALVVPGAAAASDPVEALRAACRMKGGTVVETPFDLVRCQFARSNKGFEAERALCAMAVEGGTLIDTPLATRNNRSNWGCFDF